MYGLYFVDTEVEYTKITYTQLTWLRIVNWFCNQRCWIDSKLGRWTRSRCSHTQNLLFKSIEEYKYIIITCTRTCIYYAYENCICMTGLQVHEECNFFAT